MPALLLILRVVLVAVLAVAGVAKLADRQGAVGAVKGFGVPERLAATVAALLPPAELAAAVLLIPSSTAQVGAALALALMLAFCAAITRSLLRGEAPDCHCFGAIHSEPAGPRTLIRNLVLAAAAGVVLAGGPGVSATDWIGGAHAGGATVVALGVALAAALIGGGLLVLNLLRRNGELLLRVDELEDALVASGLIVPDAQTQPSVATGGLPVGTPAPKFELPSLDGKIVSLDTLRAGSPDALRASSPDALRPGSPDALRAAGSPDALRAGSDEELLLVFSDPECGPCSALMPQVAAWQRERPGGRRLVLISRGAPEANRAHAEKHGLTEILLQSDREVAESFAVSATPSALVLAADGTVASAVHAGEDQIRALVDGPAGDVVLPIHRTGVDRAVPAPAAGPGQPAPTPAAGLGQPAPDPGAALGQPAPDPAMRSLEGKIVRLSQRLAADGALLVFWNPDCGFCERMVDSLRELDTREPGLVLISTGSPAANRELGLRAPILLDDGFAAGNAFGAMGTPSAVRIDSDRRVASGLAVGADAVLALAGAEPVPA